MLDKKTKDALSKAIYGLNEVCQKIIETAEESQPEKKEVDLSKIQNWEDVAKAHGIDPVLSLPRPDPKNEDEENDNAHFMAKRVVALFRKDVKFPDWGNSNQIKYVPWFNMPNDKGVGFSFLGYGSWFTVTYVGSRLCWEDSGIMKEVINRPGILKIFEKLMN